MRKSGSIKVTKAGRPLSTKKQEEPDAMEEDWVDRLAKGTKTGK